MIEIIVLITMWKKVGRMIDDRGHPHPRTYQWLLLVMWIGGQFGGSVCYTVAMTAAGREPVSYLAYLCGLLGAGIGLAILFVIIRGLPQRELPEEALYRPRTRSAL